MSDPAPTPVSLPASPASLVTNMEQNDAPKARFHERFPGWLLGLVVPIALGLLHELAATLGLINARLLPPPSAILKAIWELAASGDLWTHAGATLLRVAAGFACGGLMGLLLGAVSGVFHLTRQLIDPLLQAVRAVPSIAWVPLFILWFGIFETSKVVLIAVGVFFPVYLGVTQAILSVDRKTIEVGRVFRLTQLALIRRVLMPAILPSTITALRSGLGLGWMFVVAAEFMGASEGLGYLLIDGQQLGRPTQILAALVIFATLGKATDALLVGITRPWLAWQDVASSGPKER